MNLNASDMFKALAVETRVKIIDLLKSEGPLGAKKIADLIGITPAAVSQHLRILRQVGFVRSERDGYWIPYSINADALENCRKMLSEICTCGCKSPGKFSEKQFNSSDLESLKKYRHQMENELKVVQDRIDEIESEK